jgi:signal peptidase I
VGEGKGFAKGFKENAEAIVVAFTFALIIRCFFLEVFQIPTTSMEPTLLGDISGGRHTSGSNCPFLDYHARDASDENLVSASGDRIMVTKFYYGFSGLDRFDVVVFKYPLNIARNFIKRVCGLPDEEFMIHEGNLYVRPGKGREEEPFRIARKPRDSQDRVWIRVGPREGYLRSDRDFKESWTLLEPPDGHAQYRIQDGDLLTLENQGARRSQFRHSRVTDTGSSEVDDLRLALDVEMGSSQGTFFAWISNRYGTFELRLYNTAGSKFIHRNAARKETTRALDIRPEPGFHRIVLEVFDGRYFVSYDGRTVLDQGNEFIGTLADAQTTQDANEVCFGSEDSTYTVRRLTLDRDIHYKCRPTDRNLQEDKAAYIPPGHYLVLGDNTEYSHDSRAWQVHTIKLKGGREVVFEHKAIEDGPEAIQSPEFKHLDQPGRRLRHFVKEDRFGNAVPIWEDEVESDGEPESFFHIGGEHVVGRALWIWFPPNRWFRLIR